jgi:hypothetical protein
MTTINAARNGGNVPSEGRQRPKVTVNQAPVAQQPVTALSTRDEAANLLQRETTSRNAG